MTKLVKKLLLYIGGLLILALGVNISKAAQVGISPVSAIPYAFELIWGIELGKSTSIIYIVLIILQIILLRRNFKPIQLLQFVCTYLFGFFITYTGSDYLLSWLPIPSSYLVKLIYSFISIIFIGTGVSLYLIPNFISIPAEGILDAIMEISKGKFKFANVKIALDVSFVIISVLLSIVFLGEIKTVREGTVLAALLVGKVVGFVTKNYKQKIVDWIENDVKDENNDAKDAYNYS